MCGVLGPHHDVYFRSDLHPLCIDCHPKIRCSTLHLVKCPRLKMLSIIVKAELAVMFLRLKQTGCTIFFLFYFILFWGGGGGD